MDRSLLKKLIMEDDFKFVWVLANFLRRETRWSIQWEILGLIGTLATRDSRTKGKLFDSDFPVYLSRFENYFLTLLKVNFLLYLNFVVLLLLICLSYKS